MTVKLTGIPETMLIPLWARAVETDGPNSIVKDYKAKEIVSQIDYDFKKFKKAKLSQLGVSIRTMLLDRAVTIFLDDNPGCIIINLGAGLDTRRDRLQTADCTWYELDLPEVIDIRRGFFSENDAYHFVEKSMFDYSWMDDINYDPKSVLIIAEGLFMYFGENELKELMDMIVNRFPGAQMLIEIMGPAIVGKSKKHDSLSKIENAPEFKWGLKKTEDLLHWNSSINIFNEWCYFDYHKKRAGLMGYLVRLPFIRPMIAPRIVHLGIKPNQSQSKS